MVWYSHLFQNFPQFIVIHTVKGFGIVNKAEIDVFLELSCFVDDPISNLISGSSAFSARVQLQQPWIQPEGVSSVGEKLRQPLIFLGMPVYFKLMILFYTFTKALGQRFDIFSSH